MSAGYSSRHSAGGSRKPRVSSAGGAADRQVQHVRVVDEQTLREKFEYGAKLGQGSFGIVLHVTNTELGQQWAMKRVNKEKAGSSAIKMLEREVAILKRVKHPHIINLEEVYETPKRMFLIMELCDCSDLYTLFQTEKHFTEHDTRVLTERLASAINYLHKNDICHRDLKLENILLSTNPDDPEDKFNIKVTDFGLSIVKGGVGSDSMMVAFCGTPMYMAPEVINNVGYSQLCDVWSMGVIMYTLLAGFPPFYGKDTDALYESIRKGEIDFTHEIWSGISDNAKSLIRGMLKVDPAHRLTPGEIINHPWITGAESSSGRSHPTNVLEMMKQWKNDLENDDQDLMVDGHEMVRRVRSSSFSKIANKYKNKTSEGHQCKTGVSGTDEDGSLESAEIISKPDVIRTLNNPKSDAGTTRIQNTTKNGRGTPAATPQATPTTPSNKISRKTKKK